MNDSRRARIRDWRRWPIVRKAQVIGAVTGALVTVGIPVLHIIHTTTKATDAAADYIDAAAILWRVASWPTWKICEPFGWKPFLYTDGGMSLVVLGLVVITNAFLFVLVGTLIGWLLRLVNSKISLLSDE